MLGEFPEQPEGVPWPTDEWAEGPWPDGVDRAAVDAATHRAFNTGAVERVRAVVIVHGGAIVYERYSPNPSDGPGEVTPSYSMAKSMTAAMIGILVRDGRLDIDEPAAVPEWHQEGAYSADTTAQDYAKFGLLFLRGGEWDGEQILPEEWVEFCRTRSPANPDYGAHWWLDGLRPGVSYAVGILGNAITFDPATISSSCNSARSPASSRSTTPKRSSMHSPPSTNDLGVNRQE